MKLSVRAVECAALYGADRSIRFRQLTSSYSIACAKLLRGGFSCKVSLRVLTLSNSMLEKTV